MFKFVYAGQPGDAWETLAGDGFVGVEFDGELPPGVPCAGGRGGGAYVVAEGLSGPMPRVGAELRARAEREPERLILVPNTGPFSTAADLWTVLEAAHHERVKVAIDLTAARQAGQSASVLVPTLNLRIGLVRASIQSDDVTEYARRLAGVGYEGYVVCDPPPGPDRPAAARALTAAFRAVFPAKPTKKPAPAKAAKGDAPAEARSSA